MNLHPELEQALRKNLTDLGTVHDDVDKDIRLSPRRLEQIILYINHHLPIKTKKDAKSLLTNLKAMCSNTSGKTGYAWHKIEQVFRDTLEAQQSQHSQVTPHKSSNWEHAILQQIQAKIAMGKKRSYIPVLQSLPGVGKTSGMKQVAEALNLILLRINIATINADDISGLVVSKKDKKTGGYDARFTKPPLLELIEKRSAEASQKLQTEYPDLYSIWENKSPKFLLFLDELSRPTSAAVYNNLRGLILDKKFNEAYSLSDDYVMAGAMNETGGGTSQLTGHLKDAIDVITVDPDKNKTMDYLQNNAEKDSTIEWVPKDLQTLALNIIRHLMGEKSTKLSDPNAGINLKNKDFHFTVGNQHFYMSPRRFTTLWTQLAVDIDRTVNKLDKNDPEYTNKLANKVYENLAMHIPAAMRQWQTDGEEDMLHSIRIWINETMPKLFTKPVSKVDFNVMMDSVMNDPNKHLRDMDNFDRYMDSYQPNSFAEDIINYLNLLESRIQQAWELFCKQTHSKKLRSEKHIKLINQLHSAMEHLHEELIDGIENLTTKPDNTVFETITNALHTWMQQERPWIKLESDDNLMTDSGEHKNWSSDSPTTFYTPPPRPIPSNHNDPQGGKEAEERLRQFIVIPEVPEKAERKPDSGLSSLANVFDTIFQSTEKDKKKGKNP
jgi:hypothetical protein